MSNIYKKLNAARKEFHGLDLKKSGHNKFAGYKYFELADFLIPALDVFGKHGLCGIIGFDKDIAKMAIVDTESNDRIEITSPMGSANLKGCHEVQNIGAVETYQRRYLWMAALEIVEHDAIDSSEQVEDKNPDTSLYIRNIMSAKTVDDLKEIYLAGVADLGELPMLKKAATVRKGELLGAQS
jgi:hypothetical protein